GNGEADCARQAASLPLRPAHREPRFLAGAPDHGPGPVELVSVVRPQSADVRPQHLLGQASGLSQGRAACLPRARQGKLHRGGSGRDALTGCGKIHLFYSRIFPIVVFRRKPCFRLLPDCPRPGILPSRNTLLPALTPRELVSPSAPGWRRWPGSEKTNPLFWRRAASPAAGCYPACPSQTLSRSACVSSD